MFAATINRLWLLSNSQDNKRYFSSIDNADDIQQAILLNNLKRNRDCLFGMEHSFGDISNIDEYRKNVPISTYDYFAPYIDRIATGEDKILTSEPVSMFEPTSGSTSGRKLIPYTQSLKTEFRRGIAPFVHNLYRNFPGAFNGHSYWQISPSTVEKEVTAGGTPIGFESDSDYLGPIGLLLQKAFAIPSAITNIGDDNAFKYVTSYFLLLATDLSLVSVWNPSYFTILVNYIEDNAESLIADIANGTMNSQYRDAFDIIGSRRYAAKKGAKKRATQIEQALAKPREERFANIWHNLKLISCWTDGPSSLHADNLAGYFPNVTIQGKGLLSTEAMITIPIVEAGGNVPAFTSHYLEFLSDDGIFDISKLEVGNIYRPVVTTGGGLYRYDTGDNVEVTGEWRGLPIIRFIGRESYCDIVGEKLSEIFVSTVIDDVLANATPPSFVMLCPQVERDGGYYTIYLEMPNEKPDEYFLKIRDNVESRLRENFHYDYARRLGQLKPLRIFVISGFGEKTYIERYTKEGIKPGDIKPKRLDNRSDWVDYFDGRYI